MARNLHVYPKAILDGSTWTLLVKVYEHATGVTSRIEHSEPAGVTATTPVTLLKISFDMVVDDTDTDQDVFDAIVVDDIKPGPQTETVWEAWMARAEINFSASDGTQVGFNSEWSKNETSTMRSDARRALITQRGWTVDVGSVHQHEGDGTNTDE